jgi:hypothetical protein
MNKTYDYNGVQVAKSNPIQKLNTVKKTLHIDSGDRDTLIYQRNGDFVVYLPRVYENVVSIAVKQAEFPSFTDAFSYDTVTRTGTTLSNPPLYFFMNIGGLNKSDEGASGADRSAFVDSVFAKFQIVANNTPLFYTESSGAKIVEHYRPAISKLDRLHIRTKLHGQSYNQSIYWTSNFSFTLELETLENSFDDYSSLETRVGDRSTSGFFGC